MNTHVAVYAKDSKIFEGIKAAAESTKFILHESPDFNEYKENNFIICDLETFLEKEKEFKELEKHLLYVISPDTDEENMKLVEKYKLCHLVGMNESVFRQEIIGHLKKDYENKIWGLKT
jgi:hypothetical protein